ncbi:MAG: hypothetical protein SPI25_02365 [Dialister sp.]|nr:hypothetical protein [Dialister sp.]
MKAGKAVALAAALAIFSAGSALAENWLHVGYDGSDAIYYDADSVNRQGSLISVIGREVEKDGEKEDRYLLFQTDKGMYTEGKVIEYDHQGQVKGIKDRRHHEKRWRNVKPDSEEELILQAIKSL